MLPFIPLFVSSSLFFPFITGKAFAFRIIVEIVFAAWIILALLDREFRPKKSLVLWSVIILVIVAALATLFGANPHHSFWSNFERMEGLITFFHLLAYFLVLGSVFKTEKLWGWLANVSLGVSLIEFVMALNQWLNSSDGRLRADATFGNPIYLAVYALVHFFVAVYLFSRSKSLGFKIAYLALALVQLITVYLTATRSAMLGIIGGIFIIVLLVALLERENKKLRHWAIGAVVLVFVAVGGFWLARGSSVIQSNPVLSRLANISLQDATTRHRLIVWNIGLQGFKERPILGWGPENFNLVFDKYYDPALYGAESWFDRSHNILIDWLVHTGILGLLAYLSLFITALYLIWRKIKQSVVQKSILTGLLAAYFIHNLFVFDNLTSYVLFFGLLAYLHFSDRGKTSEQKIVQISSFAWCWSILVVVVLVAVIYWGNFKPILVADKLVQAISFYPQQIEASMLDGYLKAQEKLFEEVFALNTFGNEEASEQLGAFAINLIQLTEISNELKQEFVTLAGEQMAAQVNRTPNNARTQLFFGDFLYNIGNVEAGIKHLEIASQLSPKKQQILFELGSVYAQARERQKALEVAKRAYDLNPDVEDAKKFYESIQKISK